MAGRGVAAGSNSGSGKPSAEQYLDLASTSAWILAWRTRGEWGIMCLAYFQNFVSSVRSASNLLEIHKLMNDEMSQEEKALKPSACELTPWSLAQARKAREGSPGRSQGVTKIVREANDKKSKHELKIF